MPRHDHPHLSQWNAKFLAVEENMNKELLVTGLVLVVVGVAMTRRRDCNRICKGIGRRIASAGGSRLVKAFLV